MKFDKSVHLSNLSGKKKALIIGIQYDADDKQVYSATNDANRFGSLLKEKFGFLDKDIEILTEETPEKTPTRERIFSAMANLLKGSKANDSLFFYFAGHSAYKVDRDGDEYDGCDEAVAPADFETARHIVDDELYDSLVRNLPEKCRLTAVFDCCRAGTILDLPYEYDTDGTPVVPQHPGPLFPDSYPYLYASNVFDPEINFQKRDPPKDVICSSACRDVESTSSNNTKKETAYGVFSKFFMESIKKSPNITILEVLKECHEENLKRNELRAKKGFCKNEASPQLSSGYPVDFNDKFML